MQITLGFGIAFACLIPVSVLMFCLGRRQGSPRALSPDTAPLAEPLQVAIARREYRTYFWPSLILKIMTFACWAAAGAMQHAGSLLAPTHGHVSQILTSTAMGIAALTTVLNFRGWLSSFGKTAAKIKKLILDWELGIVTDVQQFAQALSAIIGAHIEASDKTLAETNPSSNAGASAAGATMTTTTTVAAASSTTAVTKSAKP